MQAKLDSLLRTTAACCLTFATLVLAFGFMGLPLKRPWIAYGSLGISMLAYAGLVIRGSNIRTVMRAVLANSAFGAASGIFAIAIGRAIASQSWGRVTVLLLIAMLVGGASIWWNARQMKLRNE